jgi:hypothetical protein
MAAIALNKFRTIRVGLTTEMVGIYTCPIGVAGIVVLSQVTNVSTGSSTFNVSAVHSRDLTLQPLEVKSDYKFANNVPIPPNDSFALISDGRLALETYDIIKVQASENGVLELILSVLETAKK